LYRQLGAATALIFAVAVLTLIILDPNMVFEPLMLIPVMHTLFVTTTCLAVAYVTAKAFLTSGAYALLSSGSGIVALGISALVGGWLVNVPGGTNMIVVVQNTGYLIASFLHFASSSLIVVRARPQISKHRKASLVFGYSLTLLAVTLLAVASYQGMMPLFFVQGVGPTPLRQAVLMTATVLFAMSSVLFMKAYKRCKSGLLYWYSGLALITIGLFAWMFAKTVGGALSWTGRISQYVGCVCFLVALVTSARDANVTRVPRNAGTESSRLVRGLGAMPILIFIAILAIAANVKSEAVFEPPFLVTALNTILITTTSLAVAYVSTKSFLASGLRTILLLSSGTLMYGLTSLTGSWLFAIQGGPNAFLTIQNIGAFFASALHLAGASLALRKTPLTWPRLRKLRITACYSGVFAVAAVLVAMSLLGLISPFYVMGEGSTLLRRWVLGITVTLFLLSSTLIMWLFSKSKATLLYWYSLALALIAIALTSFYLQHAVGDTLGWTGRMAQYLAGIYFLIAVLTTLKTTRSNVNTAKYINGSVFANE
jgi:hypothetical protein